MGFEEYGERKGISSFTITQNGNTISKKVYGKKKMLISILAVITLFSIGIFIFYLYTEEKFTVCTTKPCLQSSITLMNCMNETVDPCEDFYEFACGTFETNYPSYPNIDENNWMSIISLKVNNIIKKFLTQTNDEYEPEIVHKTRMFYETCLNFERDKDAYNYDPLRDVWEKVGLDTNYLNNSVPLELEIVLAKIKKFLDIDIFFNLDVDYDLRNSSSHSLLLFSEKEESNKFIKRVNSETSEVLIEGDLSTFTEYFKLIIDKLIYFNQTHFRKITDGDILKTYKELDDFVTDLSKISMNSSLINNFVPKLITLGQLQNLTDTAGENFKFNWTLYLRELFYDIEPEVYEQLTLENADDYEILITDTDYFENVFTLLSKTLPIVIKMSTVMHVVNDLDKNFLSTKNSESQACFSLTNELFGMVTGYSMIHTLDNSSKAALIEMTDNIQWALRKMVNEVTWMDDETKNATLRKIASTEIYLGYPDNYAHILNNLYKDLNITENHVENVITISKFNAGKKWKYLVNEIDRENIEWIITPGEVNAYNDNAMNALFIPAATLQAPLYYNGIQALDYGATGSTIGHELSHSYDNTGRLFNELGNMVQWWTNKSHDEYTKRTKCLVDRYNSVRIVSHNNTFQVNGDLTLDENIADLMGVKEAFLAYRRFVDLHGQEPRLPGMERYDQDQLFFLGYANQYCHYDSNDYQFDKSNKHSPSKVRVQEVLSLFPEFAKTWSCPLGTPMNPKKERCQIW